MVRFYRFGLFRSWVSEGIVAPSIPRPLTPPCRGPPGLGFCCARGVCATRPAPEHTPRTRSACARPFRFTKGAGLPARPLWIPAFAGMTCF